MSAPAPTTDAASASSRRRTWLFLALGLVLTLALAGVASYYASSAPDGLEKVATDQGLDANAGDHALGDGPLADYGVKGVDDERLSVGVAGVVGVLVTFAFAGGMFLLVRRGGTRGESG